MNPRDAALVAAVVLIAGVAVADAVRDRGRDRPPDAAPTHRESGRSFDEFRRGGLAGRLVFTDENCRVRGIDLATGERSFAPREGSCGLWGPSSGGRFAYGVDVERVGDRRSMTLTFRIVDTDEPERDLGRHNGLAGSILWSPDGSRVAWCDDYGTGFEFEIARSKRRRLSACPVGYTWTGRPAFATGRRLVAGGGTVLVAPRRVSLASFGDDGSIAVVAGRDALVYRAPLDRYPFASVTLPRLRGKPIFAPNNCGALAPSPHEGRPPTVMLLALGCPSIRGRQTFPGNQVAWSPDAKWIAVADAFSIVFHRVDGSVPPLVLDQVANQILWQEAP